MTLKDAQIAIANRTPFDAGNLTGAIEDDFSQPIENKGNGALLYVVRSYGVAIADSPLFIDNGGVYPSAYTHSKTTSKHANLVKKAWGL